MHKQASWRRAGGFWDSLDSWHFWGKITWTSKMLNRSFLHIIWVGLGEHPQDRITAQERSWGRSEVESASFEFIRTKGWEARQGQWMTRIYFNKVTTNLASSRRLVSKVSEMFAKNITFRMTLCRSHCWGSLPDVLCFRNRAPILSVYLVSPVIRAREVPILSACKWSRN